MSAEAVDRALESQAIHGGRLGTNLIEQLAIGLDEMAEALARQHDMPAALQRHFDRADPDVQRRIPPEMAAQWRAVPLGRLPSDGAQQVAVAVMDPPTDDALYELSDALGAQVVAAVAPQLRVLYHLERIYGIERPNRFKRGSARAGSDPGSERRGYVKTLSDGEPVEAPSSLARIAVRRIQVPITANIDVEPDPDLSTVEGALRAMRRATGRARVGALLVAALEQGFDGALSAGVLLTVRSGLLLGWRGFARGGEGELTEAIAVPVGAPSLFAAPCKSGISHFGPPPPPSEIDARLWAVLGGAPPGEIGVHPVTVFGRLACVIYVHTPGEMPPATAAGVAELGQALCAALERLVKAGQR